MPRQNTYRAARLAVASLLLVSALSACGGATDDKQPTQREQIGQVWKYETEQSNGRAIPLAYIGSANTVRTMTAPDTFAVLLLQKMRNGETGVTVKAVGAPFSCDLSDCNVDVSIDGKPPEKWRGRITDAKDGVTIPPSQKAYESLSSAKTVRVDITLGNEGAHPFEFRTEGLKWPG